MLEEALDPRPTVPLEFGRLLPGAAAVHATAPEALARIWNDDLSFWSNVRTLEYWIDRAVR